jgi:formate dehydrogenase major subunit
MTKAEIRVKEGGKRMEFTRREFLKVSGATGLGIAFGRFLSPVKVYAQELRIKGAKETPTICPYCGGGCGILVHTVGDKIVYTEGDSNHPINVGRLCTKGACVYQIVDNDKRLTKVLYRAPGSTEWAEKDWNWALKEIAKRIKSTRDANFKATEDGVTVNRTEAIASLGGAALDNEEDYLLSKMSRALGIVYLEHQARI